MLPGCVPIVFCVHGAGAQDLVNLQVVSQGQEVAAVHGAMENEKEEKIAATPWYRSGSGYASLCVVAWFVLNMIIANLNKWIMGKQGYGFRYSALLTVLHMLACWVLSALTLQLRTGSSQRQLSARARRAVLQLSTIFVVSVCCGNAALMYIHVSFSQAIGATAPLWTVVFTVTLTRRKYPPLVWAALEEIRCKVSGVERAMSEEGAPYHSQSDGGAECGIREVRGLFHAIKLDIEKLIGYDIPACRPLCSRLVEHAALFITAMHVGAGGETAWSRLRGRSFGQRIVGVGESVLYKQFP